MKYNVTVVQDQGGDDLARTVETFYESVTGTDPITVFYYAGHAVQVDGVNYLLPVDKEIYTVEALVRNGYSLNRLLLAMKDAVSEQNVIILDACRNSPLEAEMLSSDGRGIQISAGNAASRQMAQQVRQELRAGLAQVKAPPGTLGAFLTAGALLLQAATQPGYTRYCHLLSLPQNQKTPSNPTDNDVLSSWMPENVSPMNVTSWS